MIPFISPRRGAELSFNMIILAILAIIVLVVFILIFANKSGKFGDELTKCDGRCVDEVTDCSDEEVPILKTACGRAENKPVCCKPFT